MKFNREKFFDEYRSQFGALNNRQVDGLNDLLSCIESDPYITDFRWAGYMLSTSKHETDHTFHPIREYGTRQYFINRYGGQTALGKRLGNDTPEEGATYSGRGHVQLTGEDNYERLEADLRREYPDVVAAFEARIGRKFDLTVGDDPNDQADPDNAMDPAISYAILSFGMRHGRFTGKKLGDYISGLNCNYREARRIINRLDKADLIASYAVKFEKILRESLID
jgi:hypothetical protein